MGKNTSAKTLKILPEVERFDCFEDGISSFHNGNLVLYENYEFLFKRYNELLEAHERLIDVAKLVVKSWNTVELGALKDAIEDMAALVGEE